MGLEEFGRMSLPAKKQLQVCLVLSMLGVGFAATDTADSFEEMTIKDFQEFIAPSSGNLDFADEFGTLTDADIAALNLTDAADQLQTSLRAVVGPGQCDGIVEMKKFDQMSMDERSALYNDYLRRQTYYCLKDADRTERYFGFKASTFSVADLKTIMDPLPASFNPEKALYATRVTCTRMSANDYVEYTATYVNFLNALGAPGRAARLQEFMDLLFLNKYHAYHMDGRPQLGCSDFVCVDFAYTPIITAFVLSAVRDTQSRVGGAVVKSRLGISSRMVVHKKHIAGKSEDQLWEEMDRTLGNATAYAELAALPHAERQGAPMFDKCHPVCMSMQSMTRVFKTSSLRSCCALCTGVWCNKTPQFSLLLKWSTVSAVEKQTPFKLKTIDLSWV
jgi:hypothetical protein